ncbi:protein IQ-DOMAIN 3-like isoform X2 [Actinidia eriantha]|uniref:protein IQ-DOMAIN 3-like isoform X2 n=1 Tax=Actinidia eriantha TaxID=165200 RepID=UPI00258C46CF|nr:protein IQ-DOMAIN 3-like isoform X2 [Actinidia eriantha]XP_057476008.1 protein IQ-DOMAIN 3-like isoform X2 [Actinidia eriantha]
MGKKGSWISVVKKALSSESKGKKDKKIRKSKSKWFGKHRSPDPESPPPEIALPASATPPLEELKFSEAENEQNRHAYSVALATAAVAEAAVIAAQAAAEVVQLSSVGRYSGKMKEEVAAIKIQNAFRGYLARRALSALRGLVRLRSLVQGQSVKRQATTTLRSMQTLAHVQSQIRARRIRMSEENQALQRQLQQKREKELEKLRASVGEDWNVSVQSKEQIEAKLQNKQEAAARRERALAYAYSHQQILKNSSKSTNPTFMDPNNPHWGWSWLERWMAARPWANRSANDRELNSDYASVKSATSRATSVSGLSKTHFRHDNKPSPTVQNPCRVPVWKSSSTLPSRVTKTTPKGSGGGSGGGDDAMSMQSFRSERYRRHSTGGSSVRDDESLASSPAGPRYMGSTNSAKARSKLPSPLGINGTPEKASAGSAKKRLSFSPSSAGTRRHSGPPKLNSEEKTSNGVGK